MPRKHLTYCRTQSEHTIKDRSSQPLLFNQLLRVELCPSKKIWWEKKKEDSWGEDGHVTTDTEIRVTDLQASEHQRLPANTRS